MNAFEDDEKIEDEGLLDLWIEWLREKFRQEYDQMMEGVVRGARIYCGN